MFEKHGVALTLPLGLEMDDFGTVFGTVFAGVLNEFRRQVRIGRPKAAPARPGWRRSTLARIPGGPTQRMAPRLCPIQLS